MDRHERPASSGAKIKLDLKCGFSHAGAELRLERRGQDMGPDSQLFADSIVVDAWCSQRSSTCHI